jgi:hypothetical protein
MKKPELGRRIRQEIRGILRLSPILLVSLVVMVVLWRTDSAANSGLFQSSPVQTPATSTPSPTASIVPSVTVIASAQPTIVETPALTPTVGLTETVAPVETPTEAIPTETASPTATLEPPPTDTPAASATSETAEPEATVDENLRYPEGESNLRFEWSMLFDSMSLFFSYVWLCCGILLFIAVALFFFVLWRASDRRQKENQVERSQQGEDQEQSSAGED